MKKWGTYLVLLVILAIAGGLRLTALDWDEYLHYHPDERYISWVAMTVKWPESLQTAFDPQQSTANPYIWPATETSDGCIYTAKGEPRDFAYGHLFLYMGVAATRLTEKIAPILAPILPADWLLTTDILNIPDSNADCNSKMIEFDRVTVVGRLVTALIDVGTVLVVFGLGRVLYNREVGLLAAAFQALNVLHIQQAHFFVSDPYLTFFVAAALLAMIKVVHPDTQPKTKRWLLAGAALLTGLAIGSKFSAIMLGLPMVATVIWAAMARKGERKWLHAGKYSLLSVLLIFVAFFITNPFVFLDHSCSSSSEPLKIAFFQIPAIEWHSCYLKNIFTQNEMVNGISDVAFTRQYSGTTAYLYPIKMQMKWGMGPLLGMAAFAGLAWAFGRAVQGVRRKVSAVSGVVEWFRPTARGHWVVLLWVLPFFIITGGFYVKFMRYLMPMVPFLMVYAAAVLLAIRRDAWRRAAIASVLFTTLLYAFSFVAMYDTPHPWADASRWIYRNVPDGSTVMSEQWDQPLPTRLSVNDIIYARSRYLGGDLTWLTGVDGGDNDMKLAQNLSQLASADYVVVASNRVSGVIPRMPERYPNSHAYYELLYSGQLGFELAYVAGREIHMGDNYLRHDPFILPELSYPEGFDVYTDAHPGFNWQHADESFTVYDHPLTLVFRNVDHVSAEQLLAIFENAD